MKQGKPKQLPKLKFNQDKQFLPSIVVKGQLQTQCLLCKRPVGVLSHFIDPEPEVNWASCWDV